MSAPRMICVETTQTNITISCTCRIEAGTNLAGGGAEFEAHQHSHYAYVYPMALVSLMSGCSWHSRHIIDSALHLRSFQRVDFKEEKLGSYSSLEQRSNDICVSAHH